MKFNLKLMLSSVVAAAMISGCATSTGNPTFDDNQKAIIGTTLGALAGIALGNNIGGGSKSRNKVIGAVAGAAIGGAIGYNLDKQAKEVAESLNTNVNNNPNAVLDPNQDLIVSNTDNYVKIMFRDAMMFETSSANPTASASTKISKITSVLDKYPNTLVQVTGHTDSRGSYNYNKTLSEQRASNNNSTNMALNRRVEVYLYPNQESVIDTCK